MSHESRVRYVDTPQALQEAADRVAGAPVLAVDTESNSLHRYFEQVCFIQICAGQDVFLVDTVVLEDIDPLLGILEDDSTVKILHGSDYDVVCLERDFEARLHPIFDTMIAAQYLGKERLGLAALCEEYFGVTMDKTLTRHDWTRRPLEDRYHRYLEEDVVHLTALREHLLEELHEQDIVDEATQEFERLSGLSWTPREFDEEGWRKIRGSRDLAKDEQVVLKSLFIVRDELARETDRPTYKVLPNEGLLALARAKPRTSSEMNGIRPLPRRMSRSWRDRVLEGIQRALKGEVVLLEPPRRGKRRPEIEKRCEQLLRDWRSEEAKARGCPNMVVLPNPVLLEICRTRPGHADELVDTPHLGSSRMARYAEVILDVVRGL